MIRSTHPLGVFCALLLAVFTAASVSALPKGVTHQQTLDGIESYRLDANGLEILLMPNEALPVATVMVTYKVGSRNEVAGTTGATHILEHMMFKGTPTHNAAKGNSYDQQMERIGARTNATTWTDRTNYFANLPAQYTSLALELEADRMRNLRIREADLESEMTVVRNEYERGENNPVQRLFKEQFAAAYLAHPYGHPTIGWLADIEGTSPEKLKAFYDTFYWPENAVVTVIGGFDREQTLGDIKRFFGPIPNAPTPIPPVSMEEPEQTGARHVTVRRAGQVGVVSLGYKIPAGTHADRPALTVLEQVLSADKSGRLYRKLEDTGKAASSFTFAPAFRDPSLFILAAYLNPDTSHEEAQALLKEAVAEVIENGISDSELERAKSVIRANTFYGRDGPYAIASQINEAIAMGDWTAFVNRPRKIAAVTADQVQEVAARYFVEDQLTSAWFVPRNGATAAGAAMAVLGPQYYRSPEPAADRAGMAPGLVQFAERMRETEIHGIRVIMVPMPVEGVVSFVGSIPAGDRFNPPDNPALAALVAEMLDQGSARYDRFEIAERLERQGASIQFSSDTHNSGFSGQFLKESVGPVMALLAEQLRAPAFDPEVLETVRQRDITGLRYASDQTDFQADTRLSQLLYPPQHPNYRVTPEAQIAALEESSVADLRRFHTAHYGPEGMILVFAGDLDPVRVEAAIGDAFEGWRGGHPLPDANVDPLEPVAGNASIQMEDKTSVSVRFGQSTGLQRDDADFLPFMVGNYILGGSFNSRLMTDVRKEKGLTYDIRTNHSGDRLTAGNWELSASFGPALLADGIKATMAVLERWHREGVSEDEVELAKQTLSGGYLVGLSTTARVAAQVHSFVVRGRTADAIDTYPNDLAAVTNDAVNAAIRAYLDPARMSRVYAGSLNDTTPTTPVQERTIQLRLDVPDPAWTLKIVSIHLKDNELLCVSQLARRDDAMAAQVVSTITAQAAVNAAADLPVKHFVLGKTWNWGERDAVTFIENPAELKPILKGARLLYP